MSDFNRKHPRVSDGTFTEKAQSPAELSLPATLTAEQRVRAHFAGWGNVAADQFAADALAKAASAGVPTEYLADYLAGTEAVAGVRAYLPTLQELHQSGFEPDDMVALATLDNGAYRNSIGQMLRGGVGPERVTELTALGVPKKPAAAIAMANVPDERVQEWVSVAKMDETMRKWVGSWDNVRQLDEAGITPQRAVEFAAVDAVPPAVLAQYPSQFSPAEALAFKTESGMRPEHVGAYIAHNIENAGVPAQLVTAETAKQYGPNFVPAETAVLAQDPVNPKVARSLRAADHNMPVPDLLALAGAGIASGSEYKGWREITGAENRTSAGSGRTADHNPYSRDGLPPLERILEAKASGSPVETAAEYKRLGFSRPRQWRDLAEAGVTDVEAWREAFVGSGRSNEADYRAAKDPYDVMAAGLAAFAAAGGTPAELGAAQRAGIPISVAHAYVGHDDLWTAGEPFRDGTIQAEQTHFDSGFAWSNTPPAGWDYTEETYRYVALESTASGGEEGADPQVPDALPPGS